MKTYDGLLRLFFRHHSRNICWGDLPNHEEVEAGAADELAPAVELEPELGLDDLFCFFLLDNPASSLSSSSSSFLFFLDFLSGLPDLSVLLDLSALLLVVTFPPALVDKDDTTAPPGPVRPRRPIVVLS